MSELEKQAKRTAILDMYNSKENIKVFFNETLPKLARSASYAIHR